MLIKQPLADIHPTLPHIALSVQYLIMIKKDTKTDIKTDTKKDTNTDTKIETKTDTKTQRQTKDH